MYSLNNEISHVTVLTVFLRNNFNILVSINISLFLLCERKISVISLWSFSK